MFDVVDEEESESDDVTKDATYGTETGPHNNVKKPRKKTEKQLKKEQLELQKQSSKLMRETAAEGSVNIANDRILL